MNDIADTKHTRAPCRHVEILLHRTHNGNDTRVTAIRKRTRCQKQIRSIAMKLWPNKSDESSDWILNGAIRLDTSRRNFYSPTCNFEWTGWTMQQQFKQQGCDQFKSWVPSLEKTMALQSCDLPKRRDAKHCWMNEDLISDIWRQIANNMNTRGFWMELTQHEDAIRRKMKSMQSQLSIERILSPVSSLVCTGVTDFDWFNRRMPSHGPWQWSCRKSKKKTPWLQQGD